MMERERGDRRRDDGDERLGLVVAPTEDGPRRAAVRDPAPGAGRPMPRPDRGLGFDDALDDTAREHRAAYAALAR